MPGAHIGKNAKVYKAIIGPETSILDEEVINKEAKEVVLVARFGR